MSNVYQPGNGLNQFENAYPDGGNAGPPLACFGSPEGQIFADPGSKCIDVNTQEQYVKVAGTGKIGWELNGVSAAEADASAAPKQVFSGSATDPNGTISADAPAYYYSTADGSQWYKTGTGNTGWILQIGGG